MKLQRIIYFYFLVLTLLIVGCKGPKEIVPGVSLELANERKELLSEINYHLEFDIPATKSDPIEGSVSIEFNLKEGFDDLAIDFKEQPSKIKKVYGDKEIDYIFTNEHIIIPKKHLKEGHNSISIDFIAGDLSLNRNDEFLYTLFVPDRARTAFPCFDQPNLKGRYHLTLKIPADWKAMANGSLAEQISNQSKSIYKFSSSDAISTYVFSFVVGKFDTLSHTRNGRTLTMLHRETDQTKVENNKEAIFDLHFSTLEWLEEYTGILYPFEKFGFALIPSFQYGGMEHPGAILYRSRSLFLEENATQNELLGRASLIAHETAHMWFGNLVTMDWFNDVWLKEVFANFMAAKIVNPNFPEINHDLRFLMAHYPSAYGVDRTMGANPIQQELPNLKDAGTVYGAIIYQKAPIVMRHLERMAGKETFRNSLRSYLEKFSYNNATWDDLVNIIDEKSETNIKSWSKNWVKESGMPDMISFYVPDDDKNIKKLNLYQLNEKRKTWPQDVKIWLVHQDSTYDLDISFSKRITRIDEARGLPGPDYIIPNPNGFSYGYFSYPANTKAYLLKEVGNLEDPVLRGTVYVNLYEAVLREDVEPIEFLNTLINFLPTEESILNTQYMVGRLTTIYWRFLTKFQQKEKAQALEKLMLGLVEEKTNPGEKALYFRAFVNLATSDESIAKMESLWNKNENIEGLPLFERDYTLLAYELAVRDVGNNKEILNEQLERINNPDRKARMKFIIPALSSDEGERDAFFESLKDPENREHEPWVMEALGYLHHPLRAETSIKYIRPSLEILEEIQQTGDIFFPKRWLDNTLGGHNTIEASDLVRNFLYRHHNYPKKLKEKILQSSDMLFRTSEILLLTQM